MTEAYLRILVPEPDATKRAKCPAGCKPSKATRLIPPKAQKSGKHFAFAKGQPVPHRVCKCSTRKTPGIKKTLDRIGAWYKTPAGGTTKSQWVLKAKTPKGATVAPSAQMPKPLEMTPELMVLKQDVLRDVKKYGPGCGF